MLFTQLQFFIFFLGIFSIYWVIPSNKGRKAFLLAGSYLFYAAWDWRFLGLIIFSTIVDFFAAKKIEISAKPKARKGFLILSLVANLGMLAFFKYFNFFADSLVDLMNVFDVYLNHTTLNIVLPVGISFFTFQTLSYTIDVYRKKINAEKNILDVAFFVGFFPQLVAGPIVRALDFLPQLTAKKEFKDVAVKSLLLLFVIGFIKKAGISDNIAPYVDLVFANPESFTLLSIWAGVLLYTAQIYCDFSGYTDMAIACAGLLGYNLPRNFNAPYLATSIVDFWHRWHISLSTWLRDYLYIPLGGNRHGELMRYRNLMITMLLGGLWHGAAWTFVIWGVLHGLALSINHLFSDKLQIKFPKFLGLLATIVFVAIGWVFFRSSDFTTAFTILHIMFSGQVDGAQQFTPFIILLPLFLYAAHAIWQKWSLKARFEGMPNIAFSAFLAVLMVLALAFKPVGYQPFIYFQF